MVEREGRERAVEWAAWGPRGRERRRWSGRVGSRWARLPPAARFPAARAQSRVRWERGSKKNGPCMTARVPRARHDSHWHPSASSRRGSSDAPVARVCVASGAHARLPLHPCWARRVCGRALPARTAQRRHARARDAPPTRAGSARDRATAGYEAVDGECSRVAPTCFGAAGACGWGASTGAAAAGQRRRRWLCGQRARGGGPPKARCASRGTQLHRTPIEIRTRQCARPGAREPAPGHERAGASATRADRLILVRHLPSPTLLSPPPRIFYFLPGTAYRSCSSASWSFCESWACVCTSFCSTSSSSAKAPSFWYVSMSCARTASPSCNVFTVVS